MIVNQVSHSYVTDHQRLVTFGTRTGYRPITFVTQNRVTQDFRFTLQKYFWSVPHFVILYNTFDNFHTFIRKR